MSCPYSASVGDIGENQINPEVELLTNHVLARAWTVAWVYGEGNQNAASERKALLVLDPVQVLALIAFVALGTTLLWQYPIQVALMAVVASIGLDCLQLAQEGVDVGINIYPDDIACLALLSAGVIVLIRKRGFPDGSSWPVYTLFALLTANLARGVSEVGLKSAGNAARLGFHYIVPFFACILLRPIARVDPQRLAKWLSVLGCTLTVIAVCRWAGALPTPEFWDLDFRTGTRVLTAEEASLIGQSLMAIVCLQLIRGVRAWRTCITVILTATTIALQHRSVWASTLIGLMWLAASSLRSPRRRWLQLAGSTLIGVMAAVIILSVAGGVDRAYSLVAANLDETRQEDSTWQWRVDGFAAAANRVLSSDTFEMLLGPPSGRDFGPGASVASVHIHNRYVATLAYYGVLGCFVLLMWFVALARRVGGWFRPHPGSRPEVRVGTAFLQALLLSQLTYFVAYSGGVPQGCITALVWLAAVPRPDREISVRPTLAL